MDRRATKKEPRKTRPSDKALFEQRPELRHVLVAMARKNAMFAKTDLKEPVLDESPMCIPWKWAQQLLTNNLVSSGPATWGGYRKLELTERGISAAERISE